MKELLHFKPWCENSGVSERKHTTLPDSFRRTLRIMKLTALVLLLSLHVSADSLAQKVTLSTEKISLDQVLKELHEQTGYYFIYNDQTIKSSYDVSVELQDASLENALKTILHPEGLGYTLQGKTIIISSKKRIRNQQKTIQGQVTDEQGNPLPGVNVLVKGTNIGTTSDEEGAYEISVEGAVTLIFSLLGYTEVEKSTETSTRIDVVLIEESQNLNEVVVMGYNTIERRHLASAVTSMDMDKAQSRPIFKMEEAFAGTIPGATVMQSHNLPGTGPGAVAIRGISTLQNAAPLVIVDGMEQSLSDLDPNQIKSISVLKDAASASMYGSRGANGVIIIETKRGDRGQFKVDLHSWTALSQPIDLPTFVNGADYMRLNNEAREAQGQTLLYTEAMIDSAARGLSATTDWLDAVMERVPVSHNTSASISGGGGVGTFNLMLGYITENGLNTYEGTEKYSARFNTNINIDDKFVLLADFYAHRLQVDRLFANDDGHGLYKNAWKMNPTQDIFYDSELPEHYILHNNLNPIASIHHGGGKNFMHDRSTINLRPRYYITNNLHIDGNVSYLISKSAEKWKRSTFKFFDGDGKPVDVWGNEVDAEQKVSMSQITARANVNYVKNLRQDKDKLYLIAGSEVMNYNYTDYREISKASVYGKLNYSFDNRYLLELTARSDGSSKFAPGGRWGFFPSGAVAWNAHNESFMQGLTQSGNLNVLKFRFSYGKIGNENVDPYLWQEVVNNWGWMMRVPNPNFSWETQEQWNIGVDLTALNNRLNVTADVYNKHSYDLIYSNFPVPPLTGSYSLESSVNIGEVENKGWEVAVNWSDEVGDFSYAVGGMLFDNKNKVLKAGYTNTDTLIFKDNRDKIWYRGIAIENYYGYQSNGYFQTQDEVDATSAKLPNTLPGDIRYVDQNQDGIINDEDRVNLGDPFPHMNYSISLDMGYKNWDFRLLGMGVGKKLGRLNGLEGYPVLMDGKSNSMGSPRQAYMEGRWTPDNPNSRFPRVWTGASSNAELSDVWLSNAAFFRLKTIQLGYTFPGFGTSVKNVRIYLNAQDALTFTQWEGLNPERNGGDGNYPRMAVYSLGIKATIL